MPTGDDAGREPRGGSARYTGAMRGKHFVVPLVLIAVFAPTGAVAQQAGSAAAQGVELFPQGDFFRPLIADPKEATFFASMVGGRSPSRGSRTGSVAMGATVGVLRWGGDSEPNGLQVGVRGGVFAQFDLTKQSHDLINADYLVGLPVTYRGGKFSARFQLYHQSSHLGDEFVVNNQVERLNLSFEAIELLVARDFGPLRAYGGGEYRFNRTPFDQLEHGLLHGGAEYRPATAVLGVAGWGAVRPIVAVDAKSWEQRGWAVGWSGRAGVELGPRGPGPGSARSVRFLVEVYDGPNPYGQFFFEDITSVGFGAHFTY